MVFKMMLKNLEKYYEMDTHFKIFLTLLLIFLKYAADFFYVCLEP